MTSQHDEALWGALLDPSRRLRFRRTVIGTTAMEFLQTLVLFPPDDTASNLNPGDPNTSDPQVPANHGSINLGALFQIPSEGPE